LIVDEEISIPETLPSVHHILRNEAFAMVTDCKIVNNKVIVKGQTKVTVLYRSIEDTLQKHTVSIPFNQIVEEIMISPYNKSELAEIGLKEFLRENNLEHIKIEKSKIRIR
jgi:hypothetical protein